MDIERLEAITQGAMTAIIMICLVALVVANIVMGRVSGAGWLISFGVLWVFGAMVVDAFKEVSEAGKSEKDIN